VQKKSVAPITQRPAVGNTGISVARTRQHTKPSGRGNGSSSKPSQKSDTHGESCQKPVKKRWDVIKKSNAKEGKSITNRKKNITETKHGGQRFGYVV